MNKTDQYFLDKLKDLEVKPSERANLLFQEKISTKKAVYRPIVKYVSIAAAILLVAGIGLIFWPEPSQTTIVSTKESREGAVEKPTVESPSIQEEAVKVEVVEPEIIRHVLIAENAVYETFNDEIEVTEDLSFEEVIERRLAVGDFEKIGNDDRHLIMAEIAVNMPEIMIPEGNEYNFEIEELIIPESKTLLAKLVDEVKFLIRGEEFDPDRAGIRPLIQEKSAILLAETENVRDRIRDIFN